MQSCNISSYEKDKKRKAQLFYNDWSRLSSEVGSASEEFSKYFWNMAPLAKQHPDYRIDDKKIDTVSKLYFEYLEKTNELIQKLNAL